MELIHLVGKIKARKEAVDEFRMWAALEEGFWR